MIFQTCTPREEHVLHVHSFVFQTKYFHWFSRHSCLGNCLVWKVNIMDNHGAIQPDLHVIRSCSQFFGTGSGYGKVKKRRNFWLTRVRKEWMPALVAPPLADDIIPCKKPNAARSLQVLDFRVPSQLFKRENRFWSVRQVNRLTIHCDRINNIPQTFRDQSLIFALPSTKSDLLQHGCCECVSVYNFDFAIVCAGQPDLQRDSMLVKTWHWNSKSWLQRRVWELSTWIQKWAMTPTMRWSRMKGFLPRDGFGQTQ